MSTSRFKLITSMICMIAVHHSGWAGLAGSAAEPTAPQSGTQFSGACTKSESWNFAPGTAEEEYLAEFRATGVGKSLPVRGFSQAISLRLNARTSMQRAMSEFWIARSLLDSRLAHIAWNGFQALAAHTSSPATVPFQLAALACMNEIQSQYPALRSQLSVENLASIHAGFREETQNGPREILARSALAMLFRDLESGASLTSRSTEALLSVLAASGPYETLARAVLATRAQARDEAVRHFTRFFSETSLPDPLKRHVDTARLLHARTLYSLGRHNDAAEQIKKVRKSSNELVTSLSELAWAHLLNENFNDAIGSATGLQSGKLRGTFAPEAPMVMAMALNELCQYPESVRAIQTFKKSYESSFNWLSSSTQHRPDYYRQALAYLKKTSLVPPRLASEWVRSPLFISSQDEINLLFDERKATEKLNAAGRAEQRKLADEIIRNARDLRPKVRFAREKIKETGSLPAGIQADITALRRKINLFRRIGRAAPTWKLILSNHRARVPKMETALISGINSHLHQISRRMLGQISEVAENIQLIEVEILNGASHDIIWQNAHPDYRQFARDLKDAEHSRDAAKVWDWGRIAVGRDEENEVWEDELGSFKADLEDNCGSKDKYLALKLRAPAARTAQNESN